MASPEITLTHLDEPLFDGAGATKRDLVDYLEAVGDRSSAGLSGRPLSVIRVRAGQRPFMQKNLPDYAPPWIRSVTMWAESSHREVRYALCEDWPTLIWFANQRAVEYHVTLGTGRGTWTGLPTWCSISTRRTAGEFGRAVAAARLVRQALAGAGLAGAVKTSGAKGVHVYVPVQESISEEAGGRDPGPGRAGRAAGPGARHDGVHQGRPGGMVFIDSTRAHGATVAAATARERAPACRSRSRWPGIISTRCRPGTSRCETRARAAGGR